MSEKKPWSIRAIHLSTQAFQEPFIVLYSMLNILLTKNMGATPFEISLLNMLKPTVSVLSFYWGSYLHRHPSFAKPTLLCLTFLSTLPYLVSPYIGSVSLFIGLGAWYSLCTKASAPAALEILRWNTQKTSLEKLFSEGSILAYLIGGVFSIFYGIILDRSPQIWSLCISIAALLHMGALWTQMQLPAPTIHPKKLLESFKEVQQDSHSTQPPWIQVQGLLQKNPSFLRFQIGFSIAGFGLMFAQPAIPIFVTALSISYTELFIAFSFVKGLGFVLSSSIWANKLTYTSIHTMSKCVFFGFSLFLITLLLSAFHPFWLFISYFIYGIAQAGSHLVWNISGTTFSEGKSSTPYSSVNILMVGLRGAIAPPLGGITALLLGAPSVLLIGSLFCFFGMYVVTSKKNFFSNLFTQEC